MATQRYISTSFWDDSWVQSIDPSEKLMYLYLMTNPLTNIAGIYKITDKRIHDDTGFNVDMVNIILQRFEKAKKAYRKGEYIIIPTWPKHQKWREKKTIETGIRSILSELPKSIRDKAIEVGYMYPIDSVPISYIYEPSYSDIDSDSDSDTDSDSNTEEKPDKPVKTTRIKKDFIPPTIEQVTEYVVEKQLVINPYKFIDWYSKTDWKDNEGKQIKNWKNKLVNWDSREREKNPQSLPYSKPLPPKINVPRRCKHLDSSGNQCEGEIFNSYCKTCGAMYDGDGNEIL